MDRTCKTCGETFPFEKFHVSRVLNGKVYRRHECPGCYYVSNNKIPYEANKDRINSYKVERGCVDCGYNEHFAALDFDHVRGEKLANVSRLVRSQQSWQKIMEEIQKCEVRCANCHRIRTAERAQENMVR